VANYPNFNPNRYYASRPEERGNWAFRLNYEPGSTVKIFMAAILLQEKAVSPREKFFCNGEIKYKDINVRCKNKNKIVSHGNLNLDEILKVSCNVGIIKAMQRVRRDKIHHYLEKLDFGEKTNILMGAGETSGYLPGLNNWPVASGYYAPIGQGFSVTPLQILKAASSLANGGKLFDPIAVKYVKHPDGRILDENKIKYSRNPFDESVNRKVLKMMRNVVTGGTASLANISEVAIAGKTGTAQKSTASGYYGFISSFIGFFPAENPRYAGIILYDEPEGDQGGGLIAAPVFAKIAPAVLEIVHSREKTTGLKKFTPFNAGKNDFNRDIIYDFRNLSARESLSIFHRYSHLKLEIKGSGYVYKQIPPPGTPVQKTDKLILFLGE
ncbi:MAG: penicillin-binding transpeptidase domain-containing protein, partial [Spirochaetia bacterium]|nr:penicillin-binding transpeptidase domain-containing protein [Spirochaetia bacterium]